MSGNLLDLGVVGASDLRALEAAVIALLGTDSDVLIVQGEAIVALEATAKSLARPGLRALNVVTGPYGALFGRWLAGAGATVSTLQTPFDRAVTTDQVAAALADGPFDLVAVVHAEAATGTANPIDEIAGLVAAHGALLVVDAVASVGAHVVRPDAWGADVVVIGGQKALAGPAGVSALSVSSRAWSAIEANPAAPRESILSLLDIRDLWLNSDRSAIPGTPASLETAGLLQALTRVAQESTGSVIARHRAAAAAGRAGLPLLGLSPWVADNDEAARVVTTVAVPPGASAAGIVDAARAAGSRLLTRAPGRLADSTLRINHTGRAAQLEPVSNELLALGAAVGRPGGGAVAAAAAAWAASMISAQ